MLLPDLWHTFEHAHLYLEAMVHFLRVDTGADDPKRILIFVTDEGIKDMQIYEHWSTDGTFKSRPKKIFKQVITFHIHINETQTVARYIFKIFFSSTCQSSGMC